MSANLQVPARRRRFRRLAAGVTLAVAVCAVPSAARAENRPPVTPLWTQVPAVPETARCPQWWPLAVRVGWPVDELANLDAVIWRESRCRTDVWNENDPAGGSRGLTQINGFWTGWLRDHNVVTVADDLFDADVNLRAALSIHRYGMDRYGFGWGPWGFRPSTTPVAELGPERTVTGDRRDNPAGRSTP